MTNMRYAPFLQSNYSNYIQTIFSVSHYTKKTLDKKQKYPVSTGFGCTKIYHRKYLIITTEFGFTRSTLMAAFLFPMAGTFFSIGSHTGPTINNKP